MNAGDNTVCAAAPVSGVDQRGVPRPQGAGCDLGAYETELVGGKNLSMTTNSIDLRWSPGLTQSDYMLLQYNTATSAANLIPVAGNAVTYSDSVTNGVVYCYVLAALNGASFLGLSDLLCGMTGLESGTVIPQAFSLSLNQTVNATLTWSAPAGGADSYLRQRIPLDGTPITAVPLPGGATLTTQATVAAGTCFQLIAFKGAAFGTSDVLCGVPGVSTLHTQGTTAGALAEVVDTVSRRLVGATIPTGAGRLAEE